MSEFFSSLSSLQGIVLMVVGFGFIIFVHELGHFLAAKLVGVKVTQFALGFGPAIFAWRKGVGFRAGSTEAEFNKRITSHLQGKFQDQRQRPDSASHTGQKPDPKQVDQATAELRLGETEYRLNWLPLGGYVKMLGQEDLDPAATSDDERSFNKKPIWARAIVIVAGVTMNLISGVIFFIVAFLHGVEFPAAVVGGVALDSPAAQAQAVQKGPDGRPLTGLHPGDAVLAIDGEPVTDFMDLAVNTALAAPDHTLQVEVRRPGFDQPLTFPIKPVRNPETGLLSLGVERPLTNQLADSKDTWLPPAWSAAGVQPGMRIIAAADRPVGDGEFYKVIDAVTQGRGESVPLVLADESGNKHVQMIVQAQPGLAGGKDTPINLLGLQPATQVVLVIPDSKAQDMGLKVGDIVTKVENVAWPTTEEIVDLVKKAKGHPVAMSVLRQGQTVDLPPTEGDHEGKLGFVPLPAIDSNLIARVMPNSPAAALNLPAGSRILAFAGHKITDFAQLQRAVEDLPAVAALRNQPVPDSTATDAATAPAHAAAAAAPGLTVPVQYQLAVAGDPVFTNPITIPATLPPALAQTHWDLPQNVFYMKALLVSVQTDSPIAAARLGLVKTHQFVMQTYLTLVRLSQGTVPVSGMHGPLGIFSVGVQIAKENGWPYLLFFFGIISVNLVVINLLPIPIADGGLLVFLLIEKIKGSPVSPAIQAGATYVGLAMMAVLFVMVTYFDILRMATDHGK